MSKQDTTNQRRERTPNNRTTTGYRISDELWEVLQPLLPTHVNTHRKGFGRPRTPDRDCADAIFYVLRTGWKSASVGSDRVVCALDGARSLSRMGASRGLPAPLWQAGVEGFEELCGIDWQWLSMDGALRHPRPWAGEKTGPNPTDRGKSGVKRSLRTFGHGVPIGLATLGANRHDMKLVRPTIESIIIEREDAN